MPRSPRHRSWPARSPGCPGWDLSRKALLAEVPGAEGKIGVLAIAGDPDNPLLVSGDDRGAVRTWDLAALARPAKARPWSRPRPPVIGALARYPDQITALAHCPRTGRVAVAAGTTVHLLSLATGATQLIEPDARTLAVAFGPAPYLVLGGDRGLITLEVPG